MDKPPCSKRLVAPHAVRILALATRPGQRTTRLRAAFTLVEMLVVMGIIVLILSSAVPMLRGVLGARGISNSVDAISGYLTNARIQAMSQNTYVVVGFCQAQGSDDLQMQAVRSLNGNLDTSNFTAANLATGMLTYRALGPIIHLPNITLTPYANLAQTLQTKLTNAGVAPSPATQTGDAANIVIPDTPANPTVSAGASNSLEFKFGSAASTTFNWYLIAFTPQGEALYFPTAPTFTGNTTIVPNTVPYYGELFIGVSTSRSGAVVPNDYTARAIIVDGGSGSVNIYSL